MLYTNCFYKKMEKEIMFGFYFFQIQIQIRCKKIKSLFSNITKKDRRWRIEQIFDVFLQFPNLMWENIFQF
jgi:hypothetical protein